MAVEKRKKPVLKGEDARRFLEKEKEVNDRVKEAIKKKEKQRNIKFLFY